jgi:aspartate aminotransferase
MKPFAERMNSQKNKSFGMYEAAAKLEREGADIIHLEVGRPSADTPLHIKEAAKTALDNGIVHYGDLQGTLALREALARRYRERNGLDVGPDEILITNGITQSAFAALMTLVDPGDEVIVLEPYYPQHNPKVELLGGKIVPVPLDKSRDFRLDPEAVARAVTARTKLLILINPANPVGVAFTQDELAALSEICIQHDLYLLADEVYEFNVYDDTRHVSIATLPGMRERTVTTSAFTKAYAMDGWRIGYSAGPRELIAAMNKVTLNDTTHPCVFAQEGALVAVTGSQDCLAQMVQADRRRRDLVVERLNAMPGVRCHTPQGTIYALPDFSALGASSGEMAEALLHESHVAVEGGHFYGASGEGHLRICFGAEPYERLEEAMDRIERYLERLAASGI